MPKEYTHFSIAYTAYKQLEDSYLKSAIEKNLGLFLYGAVAPDTIFYAMGAKKSDKTRIASLLHGKAETDSLLPVKRLFSISDFESDREKRDSFIAGYVTHVMADVHFHPMVFFLSGDKETPVEEVRKDSNLRHYAIESCLDLYMMTKVDLPFSAQLKTMLGKYKSDNFFLKMLSFIWYNDELHLKDCKKALGWHIWFQARFSSGLWQGIADTLSLFISPLKAFKAIFYRDCFKNRIDIWQNKHKYKHPVTGKDMEESISSLTDKTTKKIKELWRQIEKASKENKTPNWPEGPNLETGLPVDHKEPMIYFDINREPFASLWNTCL